jgi:hypothetical protein
MYRRITASFPITVVRIIARGILPVKARPRRFIIRVRIIARGVRRIARGIRRSTRFSSWGLDPFFARTILGSAID